MDGRFFDQRKLEAYIAQGSEKFKKSSNKKLDLDDDESDGIDDEAMRSNE